MPAATVGHDTARIGDGADMMASRRHHPCERAGRRRSGSAPASPAARPPPRCNRRDRRDRAPPEALEAAFLLIADAPQVWALDSASLVLPEHKDAIVVTGSHGGLLGGRPETALKYDVRGALYNDAGIGKDEAGVSRLPALDARGIAGRDGLGGERPHRRRALDLRGRHRQPGQRQRRRARPARGHQRPRLRRRAAPRLASKRHCEAAKQSRPAACGGRDCRVAHAPSPLRQDGMGRERRSDMTTTLQNRPSGTMTGGRALAEMLHLAGRRADVRHGRVPAAAVLRRGRRWSACNHHLINDERCGAFAADAYARVTNRPGICDGTLGPGATNLVTGLVESLNGGIPIVAIAGDTNRAHSWKNMTQECRQAEILKPAVKELIRVEMTEPHPRTGAARLRGGDLGTARAGVARRAGGRRARRPRFRARGFRHRRSDAEGAGAPHPPGPRRYRARREADRQGQAAAAADRRRHPPVGSLGRADRASPRRSRSRSRTR